MEVLDIGTIDVIVIGYERPEETYLTVKSLLEANNDIRLILVHNGFMNKPKLKGLPIDRIIEVVIYTNIGQARAVNIGLDISKSEYVVVCHNDIVINDKGWVRKAVNFLKQNKQAGLICALGFNYPNGKKARITSLRRKLVYNEQMYLDKDFVEVAATDSIANVFKNDGIRVDERYKFCGTGIFIDIKGQGFKLYAMNFKDATHIKTSSRNLESYKKVTSFEEDFKHQVEISNKKFKKFNIIPKF